MSKKNQKLITPEIFHQAIIGSFTKLKPMYMIKNPVMFVVEVGCFITLLLSLFPELFGNVSDGTNLRVYNIIVCVVLFITVLRMGVSSYKKNPRFSMVMITLVFLVAFFTNINTGLIILFCALVGISYFSVLERYKNA